MANAAETPEVTPAYKRATREYQEVVESQGSQNAPFITLDKVDGKWDEMLARIAGPHGTPYEGGTFLLEVKIPKIYPFKPPEMRFLTKVWHPNISPANGCIHLNILSEDWVAGLSLRTVLLSIQGLLSRPHHLEDTTSQTLYTQTAQHWTNVYAGGPNRVPEFEAKIQQFLEMGIEEHRARMVLSNNDWDLNEAVEKLDFS